jgi:hypothetical protein
MQLFALDVGCGFAAVGSFLVNVEFADRLGFVSASTATVRVGQ